MASGLGKLQRKACLDGIFDTLSHIYVSLHVGDPGDDGQDGAEATGTGYAAVDTTPATWSAATDATPSVTDNVAAITFPEAGGDWSSGSSFTHVGLWKHATTRTEAQYIGRGVLGTPKPILSGETGILQIGSVTISMDETA